MGIGIVIGIIISSLVWCIVMLKLNEDWCNTCLKQNEEWFEKSKETSDEWFERCKETNEDWKKYCDYLIDKYCTDKEVDDG